MNSSNIRPIHPMRRRQDDYLLPTLSGDARRRTSTKNDLHAPRKWRKETRFSVFLPRPQAYQSPLIFLTLTLANPSFAQLSSQPEGSQWVQYQTHLKYSKSKIWPTVQRQFRFDKCSRINLAVTVMAQDRCKEGKLIILVGSLQSTCWNVLEWDTKPKILLTRGYLESSLSTKVHKSYTQQGPVHLSQTQDSSFAELNKDSWLPATFITTDIPAGKS